MNPICCADIHYRKGTVADRDIQTQAETALSEVFDRSEKNDIYLLGDIFDSCDMQTDVLRRFDIFFKRLAHRKKQTKGGNIYVLMGNHELTPLENSSLQLIDWPTNVRIIQRTCNWDDHVVEYDNYKVVLIPYQHDGYAVIIRNIPQSERKNIVLMSHIMVDGSYTRRKLVSNINVNLFKGFRQVILGDVHKHQTLGDNIHYSGCLAPTSQNDAGYTYGYLQLRDNAQTVYYHQLKSVKPLPVLEKPEITHAREQVLADIMSGNLPETFTFSSADSLTLIKQILKRTTDDSNVRKQYLADFTRNENVS
jgi:DNA repair exonuclease SbcCD nuclease subunit